MSRVLRFATAVVLVGLVAFGTGCTATMNQNMEDAEKAYSARYGGTADAYDSVGVDAVKEGAEPDSHQMMTMMILQGAGMDSDLSSYDEVSLVDMTLENGRDIKVVIVDGDEVVFPANIDEGE